ncbi:MAG TPA: hypothetical protein VGM98_23095, partial [Schlesneria sp.]
SPIAFLEQYAWFQGSTAGCGSSPFCFAVRADPTSHDDENERRSPFSMAIGMRQSESSDNP